MTVSPNENTANGPAKKPKQTKSRMNFKSDILAKMLHESSLIEDNDIDDTEVAMETSNKKKKDKNSKSRKQSGHQDDVETFAQNSQMEIEKSDERKKVAALWGSSSTSIQNAKEKLEGGRFRYLNEQLYRCSGSEALSMFRGDQKSFDVYHDGYRVQVSKWEVNPLDVFIKHLNGK